MIRNKLNKISKNDIILTSPLINVLKIRGKSNELIKFIEEKYPINIKLKWNVEYESRGEGVFTEYLPFSIDLNINLYIEKYYKEVKYSLNLSNLENNEYIITINNDWYEPNINLINIIEEVKNNQTPLFYFTIDGVWSYEKIFKYRIDDIYLLKHQNSINTHYELQEKLHEITEEFINEQIPLYSNVLLQELDADWINNYIANDYTYNFSSLPNVSDYNYMELAGHENVEFRIGEKNKIFYYEISRSAPYIWNPFNLWSCFFEIDWVNKTLKSTNRILQNINVTTGEVINTPISGTLGYNFVPFRQLILMRR